MGVHGENGKRKPKRNRVSILISDKAMLGDDEWLEPFPITTPGITFQVRILMDTLYCGVEQSGSSLGS